MAALVLVASTAAGGWAAWREDPSLDRVRRAGVLRVGYAVEAPYAMVGPRGAVTGESPEVARQIAARLGLRIDWVQVAFADLIPQLHERRFDMIAAGLFITRERAAQVRYSEPTLRVRPGWLTTPARAHELGTYTDAARSPGLRVAVLSGAVEQTALRRLGSTALLETPDAQTALAAVLHGQAQALALSLPAVRSMAALHPDRLAAVPVPPDRDATVAGARGTAFVAFAFHRDDRALQRAWNVAQAGYVGSAQHVALLAQFGLDAGDLPGGVNTAQVLAP